MADVENIVLDNFLPAIDRTPLDLNELGIEIDVEGADFGESQVEALFARRDIGEAPTDRHLPNVEMTIPLHVKEEGAVPLAEAAYKLQQKVGLLQDEGGWVKRDFGVGNDGEFSGAIAYQVHGASLSGLQGWLMAHRQFAKDVVLKLTRSPIAYKVTPDTLDEASESSERELQFEVDDFAGSKRGLLSLIVDNDGEDDWRGLIYAMESRDYPETGADTTAKLAWEAEDLTPLGDAAIATRSGASGGGSNNVIRHANLLHDFWQSILSSEDTVNGHMDHRGPRSVWARIYDPGSTVGEVELRLEWRALGSSRWTQNLIVPTPLVGDFALVDLGVCFPQEETSGDARWEWRLNARTAGDSGATIDVDKVYTLPTEQLFVARQPVGLVSPTVLGAWSSFDTESGAVTGDTSDSGDTWAALTGSDTTDFSVTSNELRRTATSDSAAMLISAGISGYSGRGVGLDVANNAVSLRIDHSAAVDGVKSGVLLIPPAKNQFFYAIYEHPGLLHFGYESASPIYANTIEIPVPDAFSGRLTIVGKGLLRVFLDDQLVGEENRAGGIVPPGYYPYIYDEHDGATACTRTYDDFIAWTAESDTEVICAAGRSMQIANFGVARQHPTDDVWGRVIVEGANPYAPPAFLEGRTARGIIIPSQGDLGSLPDSGTNQLTMNGNVHTGHLFASEPS